jgi:hypothetical protein
VQVLDLTLLAVRRELQHRLRIVAVVNQIEVAGEVAAVDGILRDAGSRIRRAQRRRRVVDIEIDVHLQCREIVGERAARDPEDVVGEHDDARALQAANPGDQLVHLDLAAQHVVRESLVRGLDAQVHRVAARPREQVDHLLGHHVAAHVAVVRQPDLAAI